MSDFDHTLSKHKIEGRKVSSTHQIIQRSGLVPQEFAEESIRLFQYYYPIETNPNIEPDEKYRFMSEWLEIGNRMICQLDVYEHNLPDMIGNSPFGLRHGIDTLLSFCQTREVPFTVLSAGVGNFVELALQPFANYPDFHIYSNFMEFDKHGKIKSFSKPAIHSISKSQVLQGKQCRPNIILLGDLPSDTLMLREAKYEEVLNIGFLNDPENVRFT